MAKNGQIGKGRLGMVDNRSQIFNSRTGLFQKRSLVNGQFIDAKTTGGKFKGVRLER